MPSEKANLLLVDDDVQICKLLNAVFTECGYSVRLAQDGFSALAEMRKGIPDVILSELNMPGMSGIEFLSVIRRRFLAIPVIAMSGAYSGDSVPPGVDADAFYEKGTNLDLLVQAVQAMTRPEPPPVLKYPNTPATIWVLSNGHDPSGEAYVMVTCPECLRTSPQRLRQATSLTHEINCAYCRGLIDFAIIQPANPGMPAVFLTEDKPGRAAL